MRENWLLGKSPLWILSKKRSDLWKFQILFFLKLSETITSFWQKKCLQGCVFAIEVSEFDREDFKPSQKRFEAIVETAFIGAFQDAFSQDKILFIGTVSKICRKTFKRLIDFPPDWRNCILFVQRNNLKWFFWRKSNLTSFFEVWLRNFQNFVEKLSARSWNFLLWVQRYKLRAFFLKNFNLNLI